MLDRQCGLNEGNDAYVNRPDVQAAIGKVEYLVFTPLQAQQENHTIVTSQVEILLKNGRVFGERADYGKGNKADPMSENEIADKFRECAQYSRWPGEKTEKAIALIRRLEELEDIRELTAQFAAH